jgi:hypothetical protein
MPGKPGPLLLAAAVGVEPRDLGTYLRHLGNLWEKKVPHSPP